MNNDIVEIKSFLSKGDIKTTLADNYIQMIIKLHPTVPKSQIIEHLNLVQLSGANPHKKQVYFISYFSKKLNHSVGATVFAYRFFEDVANQTKGFKGCTCVVDVGEYFDPSKSEFKKTLKATATAHRADREPVIFEAWYPECVQTGYNGPNSMWKDKPHIMLRKCAIAGALRSQFPETVGTFIIEEEFSEENNFKAEQEIVEKVKLVQAEKMAIEDNEIKERISTSKTKQPIIDRIKELAGQITSGQTKEQKIKWLSDILLIDNFERLTTRTIQQLKATVDRLEKIKSEPILIN